MRIGKKQRQQRQFIAVSLRRARRGSRRVVVFVTVALVGVLAAYAFLFRAGPVTAGAGGSALRFDQYLAALTGARAAGAGVTPPYVSRLAAPARDVDHWRAEGIRFVGAWPEHEHIVILRVLDRFAATFGEARFLLLVDAALRADPANRARYLAFVRHANPDVAAGAWAPSRGTVYVNDSLYDSAYMEATYRWLLRDLAASNLPRSVTPQDFIVAHEVGHVLADGLRMIQAASGDAGQTPEALYADLVRIDLRPHAGEAVNENLATELGVWALGIARPEPVLAFRSRLLAALAAATGARYDFPPAAPR
jgi:hypothetical protein